jgi:hypothetical protein
MKKITLLALLFIVHAAYSQTFEWLKTPEITFDANPDNLGYNVTTDNAGNVYMAGFKENQFLYNDVLGKVAINKYDSAGNELYTKIIDGNAIIYDMVTDSDGNLLLAAGYVGGLTIEDIGLITINEGVQFLVIKLDTEGNMLWYHEVYVQDTFVNDSRAIAVDGDNNIYIGYDDYGDSWITKLSPDGTPQLTITQTGVKMITSLSVDTSGNIYAAGGCADNNAAYGGVPVAPPFLYNTYVVKYSPLGVYQWQQYVEDITCPNPQVRVRTPDAVYFSSYLFGPYTFGNYTAEGPDNGGFTDFFVAKLNALGIFQWVREVPGAGKATVGKRNFLSLDNQGNAYFAGATQGTIHWNDNFTTNGSENFNDDILVVRYNPAGDVTAAFTAGGDGYDRSDGIAVDAEGKIFLSGMASGIAHFGALEHTGGEFEYYPYLVKITPTVLGVPDNNISPLVLWPNPSSGFIYSNSAILSKGILYNILGQKITDFEISNTSGADISQLTKGVYVAVISGSSFRLVKE